MPTPAYPTAHWNIAGTKSAATKISGTVVGFYTPDTLSGSSFTFEAADAQDGTFLPVKNSGGSAISFTVAASGYYGFTADQIAAFRGVEWLKIVSGSSEAAGRKVKLAVREMA